MYNPNPNSFLVPKSNYEGPPKLFQNSPPSLQLTKEQKRIQKIEEQNGSMKEDQRYIFGTGGKSKKRVPKSRRHSSRIKSTTKRRIRKSRRTMKKR